jgi:hypothetical protein
VQEIRGLVAWYLSGHNLKLQLDGGTIHYEERYGALDPLARRGLPLLGTRLGPPEEYTDKQYRVQAQLSF